MSGFGRIADVLELALRSSPSNCALHKGGCFIPLLLFFQLSFFLWTALSLFLLFLSAFIFLSLIAHIGFSVIENAFLALRFFLLKQSTPRPVPSQVPSAKVRRRMTAFPESGRSDSRKSGDLNGRFRPTPDGRVAHGLSN